MRPPHQNGPVQQLLPFDRILPLLSPDEIYQAADQDLLQTLREDRRLERKPGGIHPRALGEYLCMWANTAPSGGLIVIGMEDNAQTSGCHALSADTLNGLEKAGYTHCPDARSESKRLDARTPDGTPTFILLMRVYYREDKVVLDVGGNAFARVGDQKRRLSPEEIRELQVDKGQVEFESEPAADFRFPEDFDGELLHEFVEGVHRTRGLEEEHAMTEILSQRRLGRMRDGQFTPNVACVLVFATDPGLRFPGCRVRFLRVDGEVEKTGEGYNIVKDISIEGPIPRLIAGTAAVIDTQLREFSRLGNDGKFYTAPEYPRGAWYEAIVNACVHRSYGLRNMNIFVRMFDDRLVIESPGGFPPLVTPENIYESHHPRNPHLMDAMFYLQLVKAHNEGTRRMRDTMAEVKLPVPEFKEVSGGAGHSLVRVTLRNNYKQRKAWVDSDASRVLGEDLVRDLTQDERRIVNFVADYGSINVSQCLRLIATLPKWHAAKKLLQGMVEKGVLTRHHSPTVERDPHAKYVLPEAPAPSSGRG